MELVTLGKNIKTERKHRGLTLEELSEQLGISRNFLWEIEAGRKAPALKTLYNLGVHLDVSIDYLMGMTDEKRRLSSHTPTGNEAQIAMIVKQLDLLGEKELKLISKLILDVSEYVNKK